MKNGGIIVAMILLTSTSFVAGYSKIIEEPISTAQQREFTIEKNVSSRNQSKDNSEYFAAYNHAHKAKHVLCFSSMLRNPSVKNFSYSSFNNQAIQNINTASLKKLVLDYALEYHYRPVRTFGLGVAFERIQLSSFPIDLRYSSTAAIPPTDLTTLLPIASDLTAGSTDTYAIANFYQPVAVGVRGYNYAGFFRAYIAPQLKTDPFIQISLGMTHNRASVYRADKSRTISQSDKLWVWTLGAGFSLPELAGLALEPSIFVRNEHGFIFYDQIVQPMTNTTYSFTGTASQYYSVDFKLALKKVW